MIEARGPRVLVAIEPLVLEGAFAAILDLIALDEVVQFRMATSEERARRHDAAVVSTEFSRAVCADVVITLPDTQSRNAAASGLSRGRVSTPVESHDVDIRDQREVVELLDEHVPIGVSRADRLRARWRPGC